MRIFFLFTLILAAWSVAACSGAASSTSNTPVPTEPPVDAALIAQGIEIYRANYCGSCHILTAANTRGTFGPAHDNAAIAAEQHVALPSYNGSAATAAEYIRESLLDPRAFYTPGYEATNHHMPAFTHLPEEDINALVYMLLHQREQAE